MEKTEHYCHIPEHNSATLKQGTSKTKFNQIGEPIKYWYHIDQDDKMCFGQLPKEKSGYVQDMEAMRNEKNT